MSLFRSRSTSLSVFLTVSDTAICQIAVSFCIFLETIRRSDGKMGRLRKILLDKGDRRGYNVLKLF